MKTSNASANGTSYFGHTVTATPGKLKEVLGNPTFNYNDGLDKVNIEWIMENENGDVFTVYDWKIGHSILDNDVIHWHIGGFNAAVTAKAKEELEACIG